MMNNQNEKNYLIHFGNKNSGRYPRGSGENPHQHDGLRVRLKRRKMQSQKAMSYYKKNVSPVETAMNVAGANYKIAKLNTRAKKQEYKREKRIYKLAKPGVNKKIAKMKVKSIKASWKAAKMSKKTAKTTYKEAIDRYNSLMSSLYEE